MTLTLSMDEIGSDNPIDPFLNDPNDPTGSFRLQAYIPQCIEKIMNSDERKVRIMYSDGRTATHDKAQVVFNILIWRILLAVKLPVVPKDYHHYDEITENTLTNRFSEIYPRCIMTNPIRSRLNAILADSVSLLFNISVRYFTEYVTTISYLDILKTYVHPTMVGIRNYIAEQNQIGGTKAMEAAMAKGTKQLIDFLEHELESSNSIQQLYAGGKLNPNQAIQLFGAYGPRADIDERIKGSAIMTNAVLGFRSMGDYAKETLAAKKSAVYNFSEVATGAYFMRQVELVMTELQNVELSPCSNTNTIRHYLHPNKYQRYAGKIIVVDDKDVFLTEANFHEYAGKVVDMVSVMDCKVENGVCIRCLGRLHEYIDLSNHFGLRMVSEALSEIIQLILSAKHLIKTATISYSLPEEALPWIREERLYEYHIDFKGYQLGIDVNHVNNPSHYTDDTDCEDFSFIPHLFLLKDGKVIHTIPLEMEEGDTRPHLAPTFFKYILRYPEAITKVPEVQIYEGYVRTLYVCDMSKWNTRSKFLFIKNKSDDMTSYVRGIRTFVGNHLYRFTDKESALFELTELVYKKQELHIGMLETLLRGFMVTSHTDAELSVEDNDRGLLFGKLQSIIQNRAAANAMMYQNLIAKDSCYIYNANTYLKPTIPGHFGPLFGW